MISSGDKFWIFAVPRDADCGSMSDLVQHNERYLLTEKDNKWQFPYTVSDERLCIFGKTGDVMYVLIRSLSFLTLTAFVDFNRQTLGTKSLRRPHPSPSVAICLRITLYTSQKQRGGTISFTSARPTSTTAVPS